MTPYRFSEFNSIFYSTYSPARLDEADNRGLNLPASSSTEQFESRVLTIKQLQANFLSDIDEFKVLVKSYVSSDYDHKINAFRDYISEHGEVDGEDQSLKPIYLHAKEVLHQIVAHLKNYHQEPSEAIARTGEGGQSNIMPGLDWLQLKLVLVENLDLDLCLAGVSTRLQQILEHMQETSAPELSGQLYSVRRQLLKNFINDYIRQNQLKGTLNIPVVNEVHWFNTFYNLVCYLFNLPNIPDNFAITKLDDTLVDDFIKTTELVVSPANINRDMAEKLYLKLRKCLDELDASHWLTVPFIAEEDLTFDKISLLNTKLVMYANSLFEPPEEQQLNLHYIIKEHNSPNSSEIQYSLVDCREKLQAWCALALTKVTPDTLVTISKHEQDNTSTVISHIGGIHFFVQKLADNSIPETTCEFLSESYLPIQLLHLLSVDFSTWGEFQYPMLIQSMRQTSEIKSVIQFMFNPYVAEQLNTFPSCIKNFLAEILHEKIIHPADCAPEVSVNKYISDVLNNYYELTGSRDLSSKLVINSLFWLANLPFFEFLLPLLHQNMDLGEILNKLTSDQVRNISTEGIKSFFHHDICQHLMIKAMEQKKTYADIVEKLFLSGKCDELVNIECDGIFPLLFALQHNKMICFNYLLTVKNININQKNKKDDVTAFLLAASFGLSEVMESLIDRGVNEKSVNALKCTALMLAAIRGRVNCVEVLIKRDRSNIAAVDSRGYNALMFAACGGHDKCVKILAKYINANERNLIDDDNTALTYAAINGQIDCLKILLEQPGIIDQLKFISRINIRSQIFKHPDICYLFLRSAIKYQCADLVEKLFLTGKCDKHINLECEGTTPLVFSLTHKKMTCFKYLLDIKTINIEQKDKDNFTAYLTAVRFDMVQVMNHLALKGANEAIVDSRNCTALMIAATSGSDRCLEILIKIESEYITAVNNNGYNALMLAASEGYDICVKLLAEVIDINATNLKNNKYTALMYSAEKGHADCLKALLKQSDNSIRQTTDQVEQALLLALNADQQKCVILLTDVMELYSVDHTKLMCAAYWGDVHSVEMLIKREKLNITEVNHNGYNALMLAASAGHDKCVALLAEFSDINAKNLKNNNYTALMYSAERGHANCLKVLLKQPDINFMQTTDQEINALTLASTADQQQCVTLLTEFIELASIDCTETMCTELLCTKLMIAAYYGYVLGVEILIKRESSNVTAVNKNGDNALMLAASEGHDKCVELLSEVIDVNATNLKNNYTALIYAAKRRHAGCMKTLLKHPDIIVWKSSDVTLADANKDAECFTILTRALEAEFFRNSPWLVQRTRGTTSLKNISTGNGEAKKPKTL